MVVCVRGGGGCCGGVCVVVVGRQSEGGTESCFVQGRGCARVIKTHHHPPPTPKNTKVPARTIASNAGAEGAVIVGKLEDEANPCVGYNAADGRFEDMVKAGIVDPLKVGV